MLSARGAIAALACMILACSTAATQNALADPGQPPPGGGGVTVTPGPGQQGVGIGVTDPGGNNSGTTTTGSTSGGKGKSTDPCVYEPANPPPGPDTPIGSEIAKYGGTAIYEICPGGSGGLVWVPKGKAAPPPPTAIDLARTAYGELPLLDPAPGRYPNGTLSDGRPYTIVQTHMWFSTSPSLLVAACQRRSVLVPLCATAVAKPTTLTFDRCAMGDASVSCPGPGSTFQRPAGGSWVPRGTAARLRLPVHEVELRHAQR